MGTGGLVVKKQPLLEWEEKLVGPHGKHVLLGCEAEVILYYSDRQADVPCWSLSIRQHNCQLLRATFSYTPEEYGKAREASEALLGITLGYT